MSSQTFSSELHPEPRLRAVVLGAGAGIGILGVAVIFTMPTADSTRILLAMLWCVQSGCQLFSIATGYRRVQLVRLDADGVVMVQDPVGDWRPATLEAGSIVLPGLAWLRIRCENGSRHAELFAGNCREDEHWRRLQLIWRHLGAPP